MGVFFDRAGLLAAFDALGAAARDHGTRLELAVYGGAALMLASNFRFATEDVDIAEIGTPWPDWLSAAVSGIARRNGWSEGWLNDAVTFHLSPLADRAADHVEFGSFPRSGPAGLTVTVPKAEYLLSLKLKAARIADPYKGPQDSADILNLMRVVGVDAEGAMEVLGRYFPRSAADGAKQRFLLKRLMGERQEDGDAPIYPR
ncbi:hypothetical protein [Lichenibacterium dinghuense]|uniref:hypothetical protein n=1 Tax=Lichenibacterium dinghuense TaxID=2895977 RepID=UPI001F1B1C5F|nr:hypothetical protein [Lichenibacterium sp. 6Y81]